MGAVRASIALGKIGTTNALRALQKLADDPAYTGALNVRRVAAAAIADINRREAEQRRAATRPT